MSCMQFSFLQILNYLNMRLQILLHFMLHLKYNVNLKFLYFASLNMEILKMKKENEQYGYSDYVTNTTVTNVWR
jgi:hypothetical protein